MCITHTLDGTHTHDGHVDTLQMISYKTMNYSSLT